MVRKAHQQEELLNGELARLLSNLEIPTEPEMRERGKRMDVSGQRRRVPRCSRSGDRLPAQATSDSRRRRPPAPRIDQRRLCRLLPG